MRLDAEFRSDCLVWRTFLENHDTSVVNRPMLDLLADPMMALELGFHSDASARPDLGFGCILQNSWLWGAWENNFVVEFDPSIELLELFALCAGIFTWERQLCNMRLLVHCDNQAVVSMVNNLTSSCPHCMKLLRLLVLNGLQFNRKLQAQYISTKANYLSDSLSRMQWERFRHLAPPTMNAYPDKISGKIWPLSNLLRNNLFDP